MAITMRRGNPEDFDPTKMLPGEFAVTTGPDRKARKLYICFAPGIVKQLGTYEDFEDQIHDATSEIKQQYLTAFNDILAQIEQDKNTAADEYAYIVSFKDSLEKTYIPEIANSIAAAASSATAANTAQEAAATYKDNAKTYMDNAAAYSKEAKAAASSITGALKPKGTVNFEELPDLADADSGDMYNVSNEFVSTADYKDGGGITYPSGTNVYKTEDGMWDCLGGQLSDYLMRDDIDAAVEESMPDYTPNSYMENLVAGEKLSKALGKIKIAVKNVIALVKLIGTTDISKIADGSVTGALNAHDNSINSLNSSLVNLVYNYSNEYDIILSSGYTSSYTCYINTYEYVSSKIIHIMLNIQYDINYPMNVDIAYITAPTKKKKIPCMIKMNDIWICAYCICDANGTITQEYTSSCRGIYIDTLLCIN